MISNNASIPANARSNEARSPKSARTKTPPTPARTAARGSRVNART
ncbi:hypothetical protein C9F11_42145 [Streptomyces sp. YIM 121038]|nr:hypothetical protein C9F11_00535 [Streptomyces sp. YIM 121038]QCX82009.1 hypothetical protein C9F11_42145 [Streptomyces sp. YIM 121038]